MPPASRDARKNDFILLIVFVLFYYVSIVATVTVSRGPVTHYQLLADAFLAGQTHLLVEPSPKLLALPDPYDARANAPYRLHDTVLYDGKYYLFYGPAPALLIFAPYKLLMGEHINSNAVVWLLASLGTTGLAILLFTLSRRLDLYHSVFTPLSAVLIATGTFLPFTIRHPGFYEVAVTGAYACTVWGMVALYYALNRERYGMMLLASLCFGIAAACRLHFALTGLALVFVFWHWHRQSTANTIKHALCLFAPWALALFLLGLYNFVRFGSFFELGLRYQLSCFGCDLNSDIRNIPHNLYLYLINPLPPMAQFPFFDLHCCGWPSFGILTSAPFLLWLAFVPRLFAHARKTDVSALPWMKMTGVFSLLILAALSVLSVCAMRFRVDFAPWWMLLASLSYLALLKQTPPSSKRTLIIIAGALMAAYTIFLGVMIGYVGEYGSRGY